MKKRRLLWSVVVLCILCTAGCAQQRQGGPAGAPGSDPEQGEPAASVAMSLVTEGGMFQMRASAENGCYELYGHIDGHAKLFFYDFDARQISYVSDQANPTDDEANPGWICDVMGGATPVAAGDSLYLFKRGALPVPAADHPGYETYIIKMDFDGTNRKNIPLSSWQEFDTGEVAFDGTYLYFIVDEYDSDTGLLSQIRLCRADFDAMQLETVCELDAEYGYTLVDVYRDGLVLQRFSAVGSMIDEYGMEVPSLRNELILYSLVDNCFYEPDIEWDNGSCSFAFGGDSLIYYAEPGSARLLSYDLETGETSAVCEELKADFSGTDAIYVHGPIFDNHIPFSVTSDATDGGAGAYYYDLDTGAIVQVEFDDVDGLESTNIYIVAETENEFFVSLGGRYVRSTKTSENGDSYTFDELIYEYAMIAKEDYWDSVPAFERFEDNVHAA